MTTDFFQNTMRWNIERNGTTRSFPYPYYDNLSLAAMFTASTAEVRTLIPHTDLQPIELVPGRCLVAFAAFEYRKIEDDPYNEVNISFLVSYRRRPIPLLTLAKAMNSRVFPSYVWQLPVTSEWARAGGVDLFAYPKFLAAIQFSKGKEQVECSLSASGIEILRMTGRVLPTKREKPIRYVTYQVDKGILVSANALVNPIGFAESRSRNDVILEIGEDHPICRTLRGIRMSKVPLVYQYCPENETILFPPRNVRDI